MGRKVKTESKKPTPSKITKISKKSVKISKEKEEKKIEAEVENEAAGQELPTVETDAQLKDICERTNAVERKEAEEDEKEVEQVPREKVKVKRKEVLLKKKMGDPEKKVETTSSEKSFLSISNPADDDKQIKVPSYSYKKNRGIIYLSHIPHGFYEAQMRDFFSQFGTIINLRLGRSKKTGRSKGFAFVEFKYSEVAKVVAETMNNYLMFNKIVKCQLLPKERSGPAVFSGKVNPSRPPGLLARRKAKKLHNAVKTVETNEKRVMRQKRSVSRVERQLASAGIQYKVDIS